MLSEPEFARHAEVIEAIRPYCSRSTIEFLEVALRFARSPLTIEGLAAKLGIRRRALEQRLSTAGLPPPNRMVAWCRLLHAADLLESGGHPTEGIAEVCGYASASALRKAVGRCGLSVRVLRAEGGFAQAARSFVDMIKRSKPEPLP